MAINKNHEFEELNGVKCAIVERNVSPGRLDFLKALLEYNKLTVVVIPSPAPKVATVPAETTIPPGEATATFTMGVTDVTFNPVNAIFGRLLKTKDGHVVSLAFWQQQEPVANDEIPYYENRNNT